MSNSNSTKTRTTTTRSRLQEVERLLEASNRAGARLAGVRKELIIVASAAVVAKNFAPLESLFALLEELGRHVQAEQEARAAYNALEERLEERPCKRRETRRSGTARS